VRWPADRLHLSGCPLVVTLASSAEREVMRAIGGGETVDVD
jgi:hypothetical protein